MAMRGKVGLICGVVNQRSIAWAVAQSWRAAGCDVPTPILVSLDHSLMSFVLDFCTDG
jgi:enoyl-[acyl-carrier-protein] reductase (NADH)